MYEVHIHKLVVLSKGSSSSSSSSLEWFNRLCRAIEEFGTIYIMFNNVCRAIFSNTFLLDTHCARPKHEIQQVLHSALLPLITHRCKMICNIWYLFSRQDLKHKAWGLVVFFFSPLPYICTTSLASVQASLGTDYYVRQAGCTARNERWGLQASSYSVPVSPAHRADATSSFFIHCV